MEAMPRLAARSNDGPASPLSARSDRGAAIAPVERASVVREWPVGGDWAWRGGVARIVPVVVRGVGLRVVLS